MGKKKRKDKIEDMSNKFIQWIGSPYSLISHTVFFILMIFLAFSNIGFDKVMLVLTTIVSLEAIYLSIFIQMTVNRHAKELKGVSEDVDEIQKDVDEIQEDVDEIQKDVDEIQEDVDEIQKDVDEIQEDVEDIEEDKTKITFEKIEKNLQDLMEEISKLKK